MRAVVRDPEKGQAWSEQGAEVAVADFTDRTALTAAFAGCRGAFVMLPTIPTATDADHRSMADSIAAAVADSGVPHVVALSSIGADLAEGTGPIRWLHHLESRLRETGAVLTAIRSPHFQEKVETVLGAATGAGVYPVFGDSADVPIADGRHPRHRRRGRPVADLAATRPARSSTWRHRATPSGRSPRRWARCSARRCRWSPSPGPAGSTR